ncbi:M24 family metallopeptidase [Haloferacaceae archaeon DSL9]
MSAPLVDADAPLDRAPVPPQPQTDLGFLAAAVDAAGDAPVGVVHVGDRFDDDLRYLTRFAGPDRDYAFVYANGRAVLCAPALFGEQAEREFVETAPDDGVDREVRTTDVAEPAGERAAAALADLADEPGPVLVPQRLPHDAAVYLERAGFPARSTRAIAEARAEKTPAELDCLRAVQRAAVRGMARAETILAEAEPAGDELLWREVPLSTERLRRQINAMLAAHGVRDAGNTVVGAGPSCADLHFTGLEEIRPAETVLIDISPRGPHGYYGDLTRTFVVDGDGGWERRAFVAVESALRAALDHVEPGASAATVHEEAAAELGAYGFDPNASEGEAGFTHGTGHGVGLSLHEAPVLSRGGSLRAGQVLTIEPGVYDPERGGVRIEDLVVVTDDGYENLTDYPRSIVPNPRT